jgi:hypothetical protein
MLLSSFFHKGNCYGVCGEDISKGLKVAATILQYPNSMNQFALPSEQGCECIGAIGLLRHTDTKMGHWKGATFKEYICEELACYSTGMTTNMKRNFKFVNISGNAYHDITTTCVRRTITSIAQRQRPRKLPAFLLHDAYALTQNDIRHKTLTHLVDMIGKHTHK